MKDSTGSTPMASQLHTLRWQRSWVGTRWLHLWDWHGNEQPRYVRAFIRGDLFEKFWSQEQPDIVLYDRDLEHPSPAGTVLGEL